MGIAFLVPGFHDRPTGGNIYNRRIITELQQHSTVEVVQWNPKADPLPAIDPADDTSLVVDSLLVHPPHPLQRLREAHPDTPIVLLAHYLHCLDPRNASSERAAAERSLLPLFDGAITTSYFAKRGLVANGLSPERIGVAPPGLDSTYRAPIRTSEATDPPMLLTVANLLPGKGLPPLLDVLESLHDLPWRWTLVGDDTLDPSMAEVIHERIASSPLGDRLSWTGPVSPTELRARYDAADLFVLPSHFETCSMATREAMARGLPVIGYEVGGLPENLGDAPAGRLVPPDQPDALGEALRSLLTNPDERARRGEAARRRSRSFPTWTEAADRFHSALTALRPDD